MVDPWQPEPFAAQVAGRLRDKITSGEWPPGTKLPGETRLAQEYDVARGTIRAALDILRAEELIVTFVGRGSFVPPPPAET